MTGQLPPKIEILPEHIIDQIKAGEVLERPASLIKELIENSLDAEATDIKLHLIENGLDLLSIEDNGHGMSFDSLPYAFLRHATSKLKSFEDIYKLRSFGFRGEALASVAASARLTCTSQPKDQSIAGGKIIIHGGAQELLIPYTSSSQGTAIFIKDLFYNTPARLKFIKSKVSEKSALKKMLYAFVLSNPNTSFSIKWDEKEREIFKADEALNRVAQVFFPRNSKEAAGQVWEDSENYENYNVEVFFTPSTHTTPQYRHHYLFANNRFFQDRSLHQAILRTLEPIWKFGESGHYVIKINVPPEDIDVNVHPNKTQIKFLKQDVVYSLMVTALKSALKSHSHLVDHKTHGPTDSQMPFFSREESQSQHLMSMSSSSYEKHEVSTFSPPSTMFPGPDNEKNNSSSLIVGKVGSSILILKSGSDLFIAEIKKIMGKYLASSIANFIKLEEASTPLLISEPFNCLRGKIDNHLDDLKNIGFELDRLNHEILALRTIPRFMGQNLIRETVNLLLRYFSLNKTAQFKLDDFQDFVAENWTLSVTTDQMLIKILNEEFIFNSEFIVKLHEQNLKALLK